MAHTRKVYTWEKGTASGCERQLLIRKTKTTTGDEVNYTFCNAAEGEYTNTELLHMQSQRYFVERSFQGAKQEMGMS